MCVCIYCLPLSRQPIEAYAVGKHFAHAIITCVKYVENIAGCVYVCEGLMSVWNFICDIMIFSKTYYYKPPRRRCELCATVASNGCVCVCVGGWGRFDAITRLTA